MMIKNNVFFFCFFTDSYFWCIDRRTFRKAVEELSKLEYEDNRKFLDSIKFFDMLSSD